MKVNEDYSYDDVTLTAGESLDLSATGRRVRFVVPMVAGATFQGRFKGNSAGLKKDRSTTGIYTGADGQCISLINTQLVNFDKVYVASTSTGAVCCLIVDSETL